MKMKYAALKTNHIPHAFLSLFSAGLWIIVWLFISNVNIRRRITLEKKIKESRDALDEIGDMIDDQE